MSSSPSNAVDKNASLSHPNYSFDDADIVLLSADGILFHVHSIILRMVSTVFKDMFAVKRAERDGPIPLEENKNVLEVLLDLIYPARKPPSTINISNLRDVAIAADKYDIPSVSDVLHQILLAKYPFTTLFSDRFQDDSNLQLFAVEKFKVAWDLGWSSVAEELSSETLSCDLNSEIASDLLFSENTGAARHLLSLHRQRRTWLFNAFSLLARDNYGIDLMGTMEEQLACKSFIQMPSTMLSFNHSDKCYSRNATSTCWTSHFWWKLKAKVRAMLDVDASGNQFFEQSFLRCGEMDSLSIPSCCRFSNSENGILLREHLRNIVDHVPKTIGGFREAIESYRVSQNTD